MRPSASDHSLQHVYVPRGESEKLLEVAPVDPHPARWPTVADLVPVTQIMKREVFCARPELDLDSLADLMVKNHIGCVPVVNEHGNPTGMVTKLDLVEHLLVNARHPRDPASQTAGDVMMALALKLTDRATVAHAAAIMATEDIHHVPIVDHEDRLIGVVSAMDITRWLAANDGFTPPR